MQRGPLLRRLAGAVALVGVIAVGSLILRGMSRIATVSVLYRTGAPRPPRLEAEYRRPGDPEVLGRFVTTLTDPPIQHRARLPKGSIEVTVRVGDAAPVIRRFESADDREITLDVTPSGR